MWPRNGRHSKPLSLIATITLKVTEANERVSVALKGSITATPFCEPVQVGLAVRMVSGKGLGSKRFGSPFSSKVVVCGQCLVTLSLAIYEALSLSILIHESFWW